MDEITYVAEIKLKKAMKRIDYEAKTDFNVEQDIRSKYHSWE